MFGSMTKTADCVVAPDDASHGDCETLVDQTGYAYGERR
ncbi:hypothetical protein HSB1_44010 [Halogranum salarium B-1]|uniref:Uncharacterized protein n=1 Tax=Halogranum salarium B-1 TaxID=1210908 RepID=J2Z8R4_9EURY|nr:hypothetical protein HSB1_44010 [Halogranum salarium B-1]